MRIIAEVINHRVIFGQVTDPADPREVAESGGGIARLMIPKIVAIDRHHFSKFRNELIGIIADPGFFGRKRRKIGDLHDYNRLGRTKC